MPPNRSFTQEDPIGIAGGLNLYGYANGDPINFSDPFGLCPHCVGALVGFAVEAVTQVANRDLNGEALATAFIIGGISGGASVGTATGKFALQGFLSVADGGIRAGFHGEDYGFSEGVADAIAGAGGEKLGNAARTLRPAGRKLAGVWGDLGNMRDAIEGAVAGAASGVISRFLSFARDEEEGRNR